MSKKSRRVNEVSCPSSLVVLPKLMKVNMFSGFLRTRLMFMIIMCIGNMFFNPVETKILGESLPIAVISLFMLANNTFGLFAPMCQHISFRTVKLLFIGCDTVTLISFSSYIVFGKDFVLYMILILSISGFFSGIAGNKYIVELQDYIRTHYPDQAKEFSTSTIFCTTASNIVGGVIATLIGVVTDDIRYLCAVGMILTIAAIPMYVKLIDEISTNTSTSATN